MFFIYTTCPSKKQAQAMGDVLLERHLVACYNFWPMRSAYIWQGEKVEAKEMVLLLKMTKQNVAKTKKVIEEIHPYDVPCIAVIEGQQLNSAYKRWCEAQCKA